MEIKNDLNLKQFYQDLVVYEVAKVIDMGEKYLVKYITESTINWDEVQDDSFIPLHPLSAETIREAHRFGKEVYIAKNWDNFSKEVLVASLEVNNITDLDGYKRRASGFVKSFINPMMASVHASIIYGFTTLNNKFIERGYVFSEENKTLKYIEIIEKSEEILESELDPQIAQNLSEELMSDLEKYIEYKEVLDRTNFIWNESEKCLAKIYEVPEPNENSSTIEKEIFDCKCKIDDIVKAFQIKINNLNNLK